MFVLSSGFDSLGIVVCCGIISVLWQSGNELRMVRRWQDACMQTLDIALSASLKHVSCGWHQCLHQGIYNQAGLSSVRQRSTLTLPVHCLLDYR
jgi:hypothetical protein